jgi:hypothetical protein
LSLSATYRAPSRDGEALILPSLGQAAALVRENRRRQSAQTIEFCGRGIAHWRRLARAEMLRDATRYTAVYRGIDFADGLQAASDDVTIVMSGHQPTLFHPGVWFKNFAIDSIARRLGGCSTKSFGPGRAVAINLVIDNDVASGSSIRLPIWDAATGQLGRGSVAYDIAGGGVPFEQNRIRDRATFDAFADGVREGIAPLVSDPLVTRLWPHAILAAGRCENVGCALAHARHALEGEIGLQTLELPLSVVCRSESFAAFAIGLVSDAERFRDVYNRSANEYRIANRIRSTAHPVPNLGQDGDWIESPFWIYCDQSPQRRGAWTRVRGDRLEISDRRKVTATVSLPIGEHTPGELASQFGPRFKLRPRALATTMYARLLLSDLFIHGIGGAKYDELGDEITRRFFGVRPPELMVVSATTRLPISSSARAQIDGALAPPMIAGLRLPSTVAGVRATVRRTLFAPETFADAVELSDRLCQAKRTLIANPPSPQAKGDWHRELTEINRQLSSELEPLRQILADRLPEVRQREAASAILASREHSFCLFPLDHLTQVFRNRLGE